MRNPCDCYTDDTTLSWLPSRMTGHQSQWLYQACCKHCSRSKSLFHGNDAFVIIFVRLFIKRYGQNASRKFDIQSLRATAKPREIQCSFLLLFHFWFFWRMPWLLAVFIRERNGSWWPSPPFLPQTFTRAMHIRKSNGKTKFVQFYGEKHSSFYDLFKAYMTS